MYFHQHLIFIKLVAPPPAVLCQHRQAMQRRHALTTIALLSLPWLAACTPGGRSHTITLAQLQAALAARFPRRQALAGSWQLLLQEPQLQLRPDSNRLAALCPLELSGPLLPQPRTGELTLEFGLRYASAEHSLYATEVQLLQLQLDGLPTRAAALVQQLLAPAALQSWGEVALYQLSAAEQDRLQRLQLTPSAIRVTAQGLEVAF